MKKLCSRTMFLAYVTLILFSCAKNDVKPIDGLTDLTKEVISKGTLQEMKQGQALLSIKERETLWNTKLNKILSNEKERFTAEQRAIVLELKSFLKKHGMAELIKKPELGIKFLEMKLPVYSKHFNKEQLNILIESPYLSNELQISKINWEWMKELTKPRSVYNKVARDKPTETIESGSCTCIYDLGCPGPFNYCDNTGCTPNGSYEMCGLFGTSSCKRRCTGAEPNLTPDPLGGSPL